MKSKIKSKSSIIYVNFAPYENAGKILDYFLKNFDTVALFSFNFHKMGKRSRQNKLTVYAKGKVVDSKKLYDYQVSETLIFLLLPLRSLFIFAQLFVYSLYLRYKFGKIQYYFSVNAFTSWTGNVLKKFGVVEKTLFWVWDYYPPKHPNKIIIFMRWLYWQFDKMATKSDVLIFLNQRVAKLHKKIGALGKSNGYKIIPIGTNPIHLPRAKRIKSKKQLNIVFIGVIKKIQGLELLFDNPEMQKIKNTNIRFDIIGAGPALDYYKKLSKNATFSFKFHGYLTDQKIDLFLRKAHIGIAPYIPSKTNVAYYGDPSKIKQYLSFGLPVITTNAFDFSKEIHSNHAGVIINYQKPKELIDAIKNITRSYNSYQRGAIKLAKKYSYKNIYGDFFN